MSTELSPAQAPPPAEGAGICPPVRSFLESCQDGATRTLLAEDVRYFLHRSLSTPCLSAVPGARGIWLEDHAGRRYVDFHGNNVHHVGGHGRARLIAALKAQLDELLLPPRRFPVGVGPGRQADCDGASGSQETPAGTARRRDRRSCVASDRCPAIS